MDYYEIEWDKVVEARPKGTTHYIISEQKYVRHRLGRGTYYWNGEEWISANRTYPPESAVRI